MNSLEYLCDHERKARKESGKILEGESNIRNIQVYYEKAQAAVGGSQII